MKRPTIIAVTNYKGGVAKTNVTHNIGVGLAKQNHKVLLIDLDPQENLTDELGITPELGRDSDALLRETCTFAEAVYECGIVDAIPTTIQLGIAHDVLQIKDERERVLLRQIEASGAFATQYDYILIDCPPQVSNLNINALVAADYVLVPVAPERHSIKGLKRTFEFIERAKRMNPKLEILGVALTLVRSTSLHGQFANQVRDIFSVPVFDSYISLAISIAEASAMSQSIFQYTPESKAARQYKALCSEILARLEEQEALCHA